MAQRAHYESSCDIGVFSKLTNGRARLIQLPHLRQSDRAGFVHRYCLTASDGSQNFFSIFEAELADHIPVVQVTLRITMHAALFLTCIKPRHPSRARASLVGSQLAIRMGCWCHPPLLTRSSCTCAILCLKAYSYNAPRSASPLWGTALRAMTMRPSFIRYNFFQESSSDTMI